MSTPNREALTVNLLNAVREVVENPRPHIGDPEDLNCIVPQKYLTTLRSTLTSFEAAHPHLTPEPDYD